jgi:branched-chain amino acid aminotransferase
MLVIPWKLSQGWGTPEIKPCTPHARMHVSLAIDYNSHIFSSDYQDGPLSLDPSSTVFHYAQCLFEGLKAYRNKNGKITLFRPDLNMARMNLSAQRLALPVGLVHDSDVTAH